MMDRSQLIRYANDSLLEEFEQRLTIQIRYIDGQMAMLQKELNSLKAEREHLNKFFPPNAPPEETKQVPQMPKGNSQQGPEVKIPDFLTQPLQGTS